MFTAKSTQWKQCLHHAIKGGFGVKVNPKLNLTSLLTEDFPVSLSIENERSKFMFPVPFLLVTEWEQESMASSLDLSVGKRKSSSSLEITNENRQKSLSTPYHQLTCFVPQTNFSELTTFCYDL